MCLERLCNFFCHRHQCEDHQLVVQANWGLCDSARRVLQHAGVRAVERGRDRDNSGIGGSVSSKAGSGGGSDRANKDRGGRDRVESGLEGIDLKENGQNGSDLEGRGKTDTDSHVGGMLKILVQKGLSYVFGRPK